MNNIPYKQYAHNIFFELNKSDDPYIICKFVNELRRLSNTKKDMKYIAPTKQAINRKRACNNE